MGQQQLLLLVLAVTIVGLAVAAGLEAFEEGKRQAAQDALAQRALTIGANILTAHREPAQLGGIDVTTEGNDEAVAQAAGYPSPGRFGSGIVAEGAGDEGTCDIDAVPPVVYIDCGSASTDQGYPTGDIVKARVDPTADKPVTIASVNADDHTNE